MTLIKPFCSSFFIFLLILSPVITLSAKKGIQDFSRPFQKCWQSNENSFSNIASDNEKNVFLFNFLGQVSSIEKNKTESWSLDIGGEVISQPIFYNGTLYILSRPTLIEESLQKSEDNENNENDENNQYFVTALDTISGLSRWRKDLKSKSKPHLQLSNNRLYILTNNGKSSKSTVLDIVSGNSILEENLGFSFTQAFDFSDKSVLLKTSDSSLISYSIFKQQNRLFKIPSKSIQTAVLNNENLIFSDTAGNLYFMDASGAQKRSKIRFGAKVTSISRQQNRLLLSSNDNFLYSLSADGKKILWKKRLAGRITERPLIVNGVIIVSSQGDNSLYFIDFNSGKILNRITADEEITLKPVVLDDFIILQTAGGLSAYSSSKCEDTTAAKK